MFGCPNQVTASDYQQLECRSPLGRFHNPVIEIQTRKTHLLKCSSRHLLQNLWPHFVWRGSLSGNWQIEQRKSSSTVSTKSSSKREGYSVPRTSSILKDESKVNAFSCHSKSKYANPLTYLKKIVAAVISFCIWDKGVR